jgi:riboflavin synthase
MFTGIVEELGEVASLDGTRLAVRSRIAARDTAIGDSISVNGTCLTAVEVADGIMTFDLSGETRSRTALSRLSPGDPVNLERPATLVTRLGGHLVQGHVDGVGAVTTVRSEPDGGARLIVHLPSELLGFVVEKGSIALDGVSLTVASLRGDEVEIALIPHTLSATTLGDRRSGDPVNVEVDVVAKHVARHLERTLGDGPASMRSGDDPDGPIERRGRTAWTNA